jgi:hypothetical protein
MTKLNKAQKIERKTLKDALNNNIYKFGIISNDGLTIAFGFPFKGAKMLRIAVSCASNSEPELKYKVGEYFAMHKFYYGKYFEISCCEGKETEIVQSFITWYHAEYL